MAQQDWAAPVLSSSYAKPLVARLLTGIAPALSVRATGPGWTVAKPGRPTTVHTSAVELLDHVAQHLVERGVEVETVTATLAQAPDHRELALTRGMFPVSRTAEAPASVPEVEPARLIPQLLSTYLGARMQPEVGSLAASLAIHDSEESWALQLA